MRTPWEPTAFEAEEQLVDGVNFITKVLLDHSKLFAEFAVFDVERTSQGIRYRETPIELFDDTEDTAYEPPPQFTDDITFAAPLVTGVVTHRKALSLRWHDDVPIPNAEALRELFDTIEQARRLTIQCLVPAVDTAQ